MSGAPSELTRLVKEYSVPDRARSNKRLQLRPTASSNRSVVPFWQRPPCPSVDSQRCWAQLNRMSVRRRRMNPQSFETER